MSKTINDLEKMLDKDIEASSLSGKKYTSLHISFWKAYFSLLFPPSFISQATKILFSMSIKIPSMFTRESNLDLKHIL